MLRNYVLSFTKEFNVLLILNIKHIKMKTANRIIIISLFTIVVLSAGCKGRKNRCATCPTWSYEKVEMTPDQSKG
jgi:hypothetical protein